MSDKTKSLAKALIESLQQDIKNSLISDIDSAQLAIDCLKASLSLSFESKQPSEKDIKQAEKLKNDGNAALSSDNIQEALKCYREAINLVPTNAIYHANLSAALLQAGEKEEAKETAQKAIELDPAYAKGYIRLANAENALGNKDFAIKTIDQGLVANPGNAALETHLKTLKSVQAPGSPSPSARSPLAALMNNPEIMRMASQMMNNGGLEGLMNNPQVSEMLKNPQLMEMMKQFMPPPPPPN